MLWDIFCPTSLDCVFPKNFFFFWIRCAMHYLFHALDFVERFLLFKVNLLVGLIIWGFCLRIALNVVQIIECQKYQRLARLDISHLDLKQNTNYMPSTRYQIPTKYQIPIQVENGKYSKNGQDTNYHWLLRSTSEMSWLYAAISTTCNAQRAKENYSPYLALSSPWML